MQENGLYTVWMIFYKTYNTVYCRYTLFHFPIILVTSFAFKILQVLSALSNRHHNFTIPTQSRMCWNKYQWQLLPSTLFSSNELRPLSKQTINLSLKPLALFTISYLRFNVFVFSVFKPKSPHYLFGISLSPTSPLSYPLSVPSSPCIMLHPLLHSSSISSHAYSPYHPYLKSPIALHPCLSCITLHPHLSPIPISCKQNIVMRKGLESLLGR